MKPEERKKSDHLEERMKAFKKHQDKQKRKIRLTFTPEELFQEEQKGYFTYRKLKERFIKR